MTADPRAYSIEAASVTDRGLSEKRPENEDSMLSDPAHRIFAVADGVGGAQAGEVASQTAIEVLQEAFANQNAAGEDVEDLMEIAIQRANDSIYRMSREQPRFAMMATTIVALHLDGLRATVGHVGDSRLYRLAPDGRLSRETEDHSLVEEEMRAGRLTPEQAATHPNRNVISRALGAESSVEVDMRSFDVERGTVFLLCSDGITRHVPDDELSTVLRNARTLDAACEELKRRCFERGAEDNLTAVVVRVGGEGGRADEDADEEQTIVTERPSLHAARTLPDTPVGHLRRPFDPGSAVGVATQTASEAKARAAGAVHADSQETSKAAAAPSNGRAKGGGSGRWLLSFGALLLTLGAVALAFYVGMMFERKGVSSRLSPAAATPTPTSTPAAATPRPPEAAFVETPAERFLRLRSAVDLSPASEAARMATEANGQPLDSNDPEFLYLYGRALLLSDRQPEAAAAFDRAIQRINENMTPANGELKIDARLAKVAAHLRARDYVGARDAAEALSEIVRPQQTPTATTEPAPAPTP
ncbi:MAG TPA: PP2C family serine/threonine-protein phosphatase [Pyrinomonadaceae bacterium]|nr:PP2C family serine/threonine-protein phosphatase [Pyrinomonadaceae bacterium]